MLNHSGRTPRRLMWLGPAALLTLTATGQARAAEPAKAEAKSEAAAEPAAEGLAGAFGDGADAGDEPAGEGERFAR